MWKLVICVVIFYSLVVFAIIKTLVCFDALSLIEALLSRTIVVNNMLLVIVAVVVLFIIMKRK